MFTIKKILLPIDFSVRSNDAAEAALAIAGRFHSQITLLYVLASSIGAPLGIAAQRNAVHGFAREAAEEKMKRFRPKGWRRVEAQRVLREGDPANTIVEFADSENADLIMMPTHGYGPFRRLLLGSVTAKVLHDSKRPVWTAVHRPKTPLGIAAQPRRIACAIDLGPQSGAILRWASRLSLEFGAPLSIIHVTELDPRLEEYYFSPEWRAEVMERAKARLARLLESEGVNGETHLEAGPIPDAVTGRAKQTRADLLVIGRSGHGGATGRLPTNAYAIIRESLCPVLSV